MQEKKNDELLDCLVIFTKLHNNPYTADALVAGLPTNENEDIERREIGRASCRERV